jgi:hypothetical protein
MYNLRNRVVIKRDPSPKGRDAGNSRLRVATRTWGGNGGPVVRERGDMYIIEDCDPSLGTLVIDLKARTTSYVTTWVQVKR